MVGNKVDLKEQRVFNYKYNFFKKVVRCEDAQDLCEKKQIGFIETSAFEATNVESAFDKIVSCIKYNILIEIYAANAKKLDDKVKKIESEKIELG